MVVCFGPVQRLIALTPCFPATPTPTSMSGSARRPRLTLAAVRVAGTKWRDTLEHVLATWRQQNETLVARVVEWTNARQLLPLTEPSLEVWGPLLALSASPASALERVQDGELQRLARLRAQIDASVETLARLYAQLEDHRETLEELRAQGLVASALALADAQTAAEAAAAPSSTPLPPPQLPQPQPQPQSPTPSRTLKSPSRAAPSAASTSTLTEGEVARPSLALSTVGQLMMWHSEVTEMLEAELSLKRHLLAAIFAPNHQALDLSSSSSLATPTSSALRSSPPPPPPPLASLPALTWAAAASQGDASTTGVTAPSATTSLYVTTLSLEPHLSASSLTHIRNAAHQLVSLQLTTT